MRPTHNNDQISSRFLPWITLCAIVGILYYFYAPYQKSEVTSALHNTANHAETESFTQEYSELIDANSEMQSLALDALALEELHEFYEDNQEDANTILTEQTQENEVSSGIVLTRGVFEKRLKNFGATANAWRSIKNSDLNPVLVQQLEGLEKRLNQSYRWVEVLYSDYVRNDEVDPINSKLLAVRTDKWTFFVKEERGQLWFYDIDGNAPEASMDRAPFAYSRISSPFNMQRLHPITRRVRPHTGVDLKGPYGAPIKTTGDGVVTFAGWQNGYGRLVIIRHPNGYETRYAHLSAIDTTVGKNVKRGEVIGKLGNSGASTGAHLHFEVRINGVPQNPMTVKLPDYKPLKASEMQTWRQYAGLYIETMNDLNGKITNK